MCFLEKDALNVKFYQWLKNIVFLSYLQKSSSSEHSEGIVQHFGQCLLWFLEEIWTGTLIAVMAVWVESAN